MAARFKIVKTEKKTFLESMSVQRIIKKDVNYKSDSTPIGTPDSRVECKQMCTLLNETSNYVNQKPSKVNSKSEGTPMGTPYFKSVGTPISTLPSKCNCTLMGPQIGPTDSKMRVEHQDEGGCHSL